MNQNVDDFKEVVVTEFPILSAKSAINGLVILDENNLIVEANQAAQRLLMADASFVGQSFPLYLETLQAVVSHRDGLQVSSITEMLDSARRNHRTSHQYMIVVGDEEEQKSLLMEVSTIQAQTPEHSNLVLISLTDITKFKQQEDLLSKQMKEVTDQNRQWITLYNSMLESIVLVDTMGKVLSMNPATETITGYKAAEGIGKHIGELFPKVDATVPGVDDQGRSGFRQALEESRPSDLFEAVVATKDGRHIWVTYTYTPIRDPKGEITALARVTSDVSTVKAVDQMKNDFVSIASHELRTPLGVITSYLTLFLMGQLGELTDEQKMYMQRIFNASSDMSALVEDLLNMSRIESGKAEVAEQPFYMRDLIDEVLSQLEQRIQSKKVKIKTVIPKKKFIVHADKQKIEQALTNIIDNAIKYTYDNGVITITLKEQKDSVSVSVKDSGVGIKPENLGHIFEKFYRENNPLSVKEGGSGLGLYISRKLVELHGGTISVASTRKSGSTFTITLPAKRANAR